MKFTVQPQTTRGMQMPSAVCCRGQCHRSLVHCANRFNTIIIVVVLSWKYVFHSYGFLINYYYFFL